MDKILITFTVLLLSCQAAWALPSREEVQAFNAEIERERAAFEQSAQTFHPGPATKEIEKFRQEQAARKIAFENRTQGMGLEAKKAEIAVYQTQTRAADAALRAKLDSLDASPVKARNDLAAYRKARVDAKLKLDAAMQGMTLAEKRSAIAQFNAAARADDAAQTAALREPVIEENLPDKRRDFERKIIEKQRAFYDRN